MNLLIVLSHLMSKNCELGEESVARADMAIKIRIVYYYEVFLRDSLRGDLVLGLKYRVMSSLGGLVSVLSSRFLQIKKNTNFWY